MPLRRCGPPGVGSRAVGAAVGSDSRVAGGPWVGLCPTARNYRDSVCVCGACNSVHPGCWFCSLCRLLLDSDALAIGGVLFWFSSVAVSS